MHATDRVFVRREDDLRKQEAERHAQEAAKQQPLTIVVQQYNPEVAKQGRRRIIMVWFELLY